MSDKKVVIYSAVWCAFCHATKQYLDQKGIKYEDRDIEKKPEWAKEAVEKSGQSAIPVIDIDGTVIVGFDRPKIDAALAA